MVVVDTPCNTYVLWKLRVSGELGELFHDRLARQILSDLCGLKLSEAVLHKIESSIWKAMMWDFIGTPLES